MAHFAEIINDRVARVVVVDNEFLRDEDGVEREELGAAFLVDLLGPGTWVQTSYNASIRRKYAGIGDAYDPVLNVFYAAVPPHASWRLDANKDWQPPVARPSSPGVWEWDEAQQAWIDGTGATDNVSFTLRFTGAEQERIKASTDPNVRGFITELRRNQRVRVRSSRTVIGVNYLQSNGYLDHANRATEILAS